jgi:L-aspartate oxidase
LDKTVRTLIKNPNCWGVYALDVDKNEINRFMAKCVLLATGSIGQVYLHTTNPSIATGDGVAMAYRAGAWIGNMEFMQFHPTSLFHPKAGRFLISEAVRGFGGILRTNDGEAFMTNYHKMKDLAPRDIVARAIDSELKKRGEDCVYLDITHLPKKKTQDRFPNIYKTCLQYGINITREPIPVVPAAHYACGGVATDLHGKSSIRGLYAAGEVGFTGVHGANRLASNSLLEALVFAHQASLDSVEFIKKVSPPYDKIPEWSEEGTFNSEEWILISHDLRDIQRLMWDYVGIVRSDLRLSRAERRIRLISDEIEDFYKRTRVSEDLLELRNLACVASLIIDCARFRKESRGLHFTTDYPERDDHFWNHDTLVHQHYGIQMSMLDRFDW